ncbi:quinolinate synthase NadA [bacterium]|nr:quinolinate synthase NadA [bacterium]
MLLIKKINTLKKKHNAVILAHNYQLPDEHAGYPMAEMITARQLMELKRKHPNVEIICYVNTTAEVKALCHICCTSANAVDMINGPLKNEKEIIFY